jgi:excisionase family DNA binding protein
MNDKTVERFQQYRDVTSGDLTAAAALTIADALERSIEAMTPQGALGAADTAPPSAMITVRDTAARLGVSPHTIYDLVQSGRLPCQRIGTGRGTIRIRLADLDAFTTASAGRLIRRGDPPDSGSTKLIRR